MTKRDIYQEVTDRIIAELEKGLAPWIRPWKTLKGEDAGIPKNFATGHAYRGINIPLLWAARSSAGYESDQWITFNQAKALGGNVRKGEKAELVVFWKISRLKDHDEETGEEDEKTIPLLKHYNVFNIAQCEGLPAQKPQPAPTWNPIEKAEAVIAATGADIRHGGDKAFFSVAGNYIRLPHKAAFAEGPHYYATALHELTHWTGHPARLNRKFGGFASQVYAREELIAEMGAAFLGAEIGLPIEKLQHPEYIGNWLAVLKGDKKAVIVAAGRAQKAADCILQRKFEEEKTTEPERKAA